MHEFYKRYKRSNIFHPPLKNSWPGVLYDNICMLQRAACLANQDIQRAPLNTCGGKIRLIMMVAMMIMIVMLMMMMIARKHIPTMMVFRPQWWWWESHNGWSWLWGWLWWRSKWRWCWWWWHKSKMVEQASVMRIPSGWSPQSTANSPLLKRFESLPTNLEHFPHWGRLFYTVHVGMLFNQFPNSSVFRVKNIPARRTSLVSPQSWRSSCLILS